ncbi:hypothetical protein H7H51_07730 [Mycolicibacterium farcinogenes]|nr:hypothetical protein [Mycolicibacterium farcinogenes]
MSLLNGGLVKAKGITTDTEFVDRFIANITPAEWRILEQLPPIGRATELVAIVAEVRTLPRYPLPAEHPLNPASRYAEAVES